MNEVNWSHPSITSLKVDDPITFICNKAKELVFKAIQNGWEGPPYDPLWLANFAGHETSARCDVLDARTVPNGKGKLTIEYNPSRPLGRFRFSIAHEIAHALFPDCAESIRYRSAPKYSQHERQLEMLCNIAAAEILMAGLDPGKLKDELPSIEEFLKLRILHGVSTETILLYATSHTNYPCSVFFASPENSGPESRHYKIRYHRSSRTARGISLSSKISPADSAIRQCTAIGYTAKASENWLIKGKKVHVEYVGLPPYPGDLLPRIAGLVRLEEKDRTDDGARINYLNGDALEPRGVEKLIIAHIVNDKTPNWGAGFGLAMRKRYPETQSAFKKWAIDRENLSLGKSFISLTEKGFFAFQMICQKGYGPSASPRLRYDSLFECLEQLRQEAKKLNASVHMPRLGSGNAGGSWKIISEMIDQQLVQHGISVTVYDLP